MAKWGGEDGEANLGGEVGRRGGNGGKGAARNGGKVTQAAAGKINTSSAACARARTRARAPEDAGADRIDNNLSIPFWKLVDALVEFSNIGNH